MVLSLGGGTSETGWRRRRYRRNTRTVFHSMGLHKCLAGWSIVLALAITGLPSTARAGFADGCQAFHFAVESYRSGAAQKPDVDLGVTTLDSAIALWRRSAWMEDDLLSQYWLGMLYRNGLDLNTLTTVGETPDCVSQFYTFDLRPYGADSPYTIYQERVEAATWFFMAAINPTTGGPSNLLPAKINEYRQSAASSLATIISSFGTEELREVEQRVQYILSKRRAEGYLRLAEIYDKRGRATGDGLGTVGAGGQPLDELVEQQRATEKPQSEQERILCTFFGINCPPPPPPDPAPGDQAGAGDNWLGADILSLIARPNNIDALTFYTLAANEGHPLARLLLVELTSSIGFEDPSVTIAAQKSEKWQAPFEYYPGGYDFYPLGHRDDWMTDWTSAESLWALSGALKRVDANLNESHIMHALRTLGYYKGSKAKAYQAFQKDLGERPTGELTPLQTVRLLQKSADTGDRVSQVTLGTMYGNGWGVPRSLARAKFWFELAAKQNSAEAHLNLYRTYDFEGDARRADYHLGQACKLNRSLVAAKGGTCR